MNPVLTVIVSLGALFFILPIIRDSGPAMFFNPDALLIILGGSLIALVLGFPYRRVRAALGHLNWAFKPEEKKEDLLQDILFMARLHRKGAIREMERRLPEIRNDYLRLGFQLLLSRHTPPEIQGALERESAERGREILLTQNLLKTLAKLTPALGLAGTVVSLIKMFDRFQSIETLTSLMAVALLSTFYGVILSNLVILPLSSKVKEKALAEETLLDLTIEGLLAVHAGEHPLKIEERLAGLSVYTPNETVVVAATPAWQTVKTR